MRLDTPPAIFNRSKLTAHDAVILAELSDAQRWEPQADSLRILAGQPQPRTRFTLARYDNAPVVIEVGFLSPRELQWLADLSARQGYPFQARRLLRLAHFQTEPSGKVLFMTPFKTDTTNRAEERTDNAS